ncbi:MAG: hypothetical protein CR988_01000 [Treponema sp.]|nr:MAG: hypothetical protein CR988_01000 [Treponema sp.]
MRVRGRAPSILFFAPVFSKAIFDRKEKHCSNKIQKQKKDYASPSGWRQSDSFAQICTLPPFLVGLDFFLNKP